MKKRYWLLYLIILVSCSPLKKTSGLKKTALTNVAVIDVVNGVVIPNQTVVIEGDKITAMGSASDLKLGKNFSIIDATGKYLMPGLWDMHVHLELAQKESLPHFIAYGVTGVRDMGTNSFDLIKNWDKEIQQGKQVGPHIITPGPIIDGPFFVDDLRVTVNTATEGRKTVDSLVALGVDFIKIHQQISKEAYLAVADQAAKHNIPFVGHKPSSVSLEDVINAGQKSIEHILSVEWNDSTITQLKNKEIYFTPNLLIIDKIAHYNDPTQRNDKHLESISPKLKYHWDKQTEAWGENVDKTVAYMQSLMPAMQERTASLHEAGVPLLAGTDVGIPYAYPGSSLHEELELMVASGLSPFQALQTATINPAKFLQKEHLFGTIQKGKRADLVLLNSNPLEDISNTKDINTVFFQGKMFTRSDLNEIMK